MTEIAVTPAAAPSALVRATPADLLRIVVEQNAPLEKIEKLMDLQERWEKNEARKLFSEAMAKFRAEHIKVIRSAEVQSGPMKGLTYAKLSDFVEATAAALSSAGLSVSWRTLKQEKDWIEIACVVRHSAGYEEETPLGGPIDNSGAKNPIQARASTVTYLKKYTMKMALGLAEQDDDDDGNGGPDRSERDERPRREPEQRTEFYSKSKFETNLPTWTKLIESGKSTADAIIAKVESTGATLTPEQKLTIEAVKAGGAQ